MSYMKLTNFLRLTVGCIVLTWCSSNENSITTSYQTPSYTSERYCDSNCQQLHLDSMDTMSIAEKLEICDELVALDPYWMEGDVTRNVCIYSLLTGNIQNYNPSLCDSMKGNYIQDKLTISWKDQCLQKISKHKEDLNICELADNFDQCMWYNVDILLNNKTYNCERLNSKTNKESCERYESLVKYGSIFYSPYTSENKDVNELLLGHNQYFLDYFWWIDKLCEKFSSVGTSTEISKYNRCILQYMETHNISDLEICQLLKYEDMDGVTIKDGCILSNIIEWNNDVKDCAYMEKSQECIAIILSKWSGTKQCNGLRGSDLEFCLERTTVSPPQTQTIKQPIQNCNIKGNVSYDTWERIYHLPWCPNYDDTKINSARWERWFCSEQEAINAGRRKAYNC